MSAERLEKILARATAALAREQDFAHRVLLDFGDAGAVHVDGPAGAAAIGRGAADCTVRVSLDDFIAIARGALDPAKAFLSGKLKIDGDFGLAIALAKQMRGVEV